MKAIKKVLKKLTYFDIALIVLLTILFLGFFFFFYRKAEYANIRVKVTDQEVLYARTLPTTWYANQFVVGDVERDALGRVISEIVGIERFNVKSDKKVVYLDLRVRATYDTRTKLYSARGRPLIFGTPVRFNFSKVTFDGIVTEFPNSSAQKNLKTTNTKVTALLRGIEPEKVPDEPEILKAVKVGDKIYDSNGKVLAEVLDLKIRPAERVTQTTQGELLLRHDPLYKDALFTLNIRSKILDNEPFMFDNIPFKIGERLPLNFEDVSLFPVIIKIFPQ